MPVAADSHRAPTSPARARFVAKEKTACRIGANAQSGLRAFHDNLRRGSRDSCQQPIETTFTGHEFHFPRGSIRYQFVVAFRNTQNLVDGLNPLARNSFSSDDRTESLPQCVAKSRGPQGWGLGGVRLGGGKR